MLLKRSSFKIIVDKSFKIQYFKNPGRKEEEEGF